MMRPCRVILAFAAVILSGPLLSASPIPSPIAVPFTVEGWSGNPVYSTNPSLSPYLGSFNFQSTSTAPPVVVMNGNYVLSVTFTPNPSGPLGYSDPDWRPGFTDRVTLATPFQARVGIMDNASGQFNLLEVSGLAFGDWLHLGNGSWLASQISLTQVGGPGEATIGANEYILSIGGATNYNGGAVTSSIVAAVATPEPATLGLICCGIGPVALSFARSRQGKQKIA